MAANTPEIQTSFKHVLITNVKMNDGSTTQIVTLFDNKKINFEEVNVGIWKGLEQTRNVAAMKSTAGSLTNGVFNPCIFFKEAPVSFDESAYECKVKF